MNNLELEKLANEIRKSIVTAVHSAKIRSIRVDLCLLQIFLRICISKK